MFCQSLMLLLLLLFANIVSITMVSGIRLARTSILLVHKKCFFPPRRRNKNPKVVNENEKKNTSSEYTITMVE